MTRPTLDYSSPANERRRELDAEARRRKGIEDYNEATFGERRPIAAAMTRTLTLMAVVAVGYLALRGYLPRRGAGLVLWLPILAFLLWQGVRGGWHIPS